MGAMTWWDHQTESVWSQVWGQAIEGPLKGTTLDLIPAAIVPWGTWKQEHPDTQAMITDGLSFVSRESPIDEWVIGIAIEDNQKAYYFTDVADAGLINDTIGPYPIALYANPESRNVHVYLRQVGDHVVELSLDDTGEYLIDANNNRWDIARGLPATNASSAESLLMVPYMSSFDWAWLDFYPTSEIYPADKATN